MLNGVRWCQKNLHVQGREQDKTDEREMGGEGMGGWVVGGKEGSSWMGGKEGSSWVGGKGKIKGRIEVRLPLLKALDNARSRLRGNNAKDRTLTCV